MKRQKKRPPARKAPHFPESLQAVIDDFLVAAGEEAANGLNTAAAMARIDPDAPGVAGQVAYWSHVLSAVKWLRARVRQRQAHLLPPTPEQGPQAKAG